MSMKLIKKIYLQLKLLRYLKSGEHVNRHRVAEQVQVLKALFGIKLRDESLNRHLINLEHIVTNKKLFKIQLDRIRG